MVYAAEYQRIDDLPLVTINGEITVHPIAYPESLLFPVGTGDGQAIGMICIVIRI